MKRKNYPWQAFTLAIVTTFTAELLFGTTPISRAFLLIPQLIYYGSASILIREIARRNNFRWLQIMLLAVAFAFVEEGLTLQSFFNPNFVGTDLTYGRMQGVNVPWVIFATGFHAFWSICTSLLITELIFPKTATAPWIGKVGVWVFGLLFIAVCLGLHKQMQKISGFSATPVMYIVTFCAVIALVLLAFKLPSSGRNITANTSNPGFWLVLLTAFAVGAGWQFGLFFHYIFPATSPVIDIAIAPVLLVIGGIVLTRFSGSQSWNDEKKSGLAIGMILADLMMGYFITQNNPLDHIGQIVIIIVVLSLLFVLVQRIRKNAV